MWKDEWTVCDHSDFDKKISYQYQAFLVAPSILTEMI